ncbi:hypothetical protein MNBD_GAMMA04-1521 [hydrothermal vent metagenome]|uniref:N-acetyltransferase domain-containing protein n=1 Tax=hydrothermal vent metagenome TaxID=652676 RepID=A0A3B0VYU3_9ZZZZ
MELIELKMETLIRLVKQIDLESERLILRSFRISDASRIKELAGNPNVSKTTRSIPYPYENGMAESWIESTKELTDSGKSLIYAIELKNEQTLVGSVGLIDIVNSEAVLGFWIGEDYWGMGYCTEAVKSVFNYYFYSLGLKKITAEHLTYNVASGQVMKKSGMSHVGSVKKECRVGEVGDIEMYEIIHT